MFRVRKSFTLEGGILIKSVGFKFDKYGIVSVPIVDPHILGMYSI